jgi:hypothetical protein
MNLKEISRDIVAEIQFREKFQEEDFKSLSEKVEKILKKQVVNILEPESVYEKGEVYEGYGEYIGIVDTYPYGTDYFLRQHHFRIPTDGSNVPSKINQILIREIKK